MADEQDELAALYGDLEETVVAATNIVTSADEPPKAAPQAAEDDNSLFMQLYGDQPAPEEPTEKPFDPREAALAAERGMLSVSIPCFEK